MKKETTNEDILIAIDDVLKSIKDFAELTPTKEETPTKEDFSNLEKRLTKVESQMVTKVYLDKKIEELKGDSNSMLRKEDNKLKAVVNKLKQKKVFSTEDKKEVCSLEPFPEINNI